GRQGSGMGLVVRPAGLVQKVRLPAGAWTVRFSYRPAGAVAGLALSAATAVLLLAGLVLDATLLRRRNRRRGAPPAGEGDRPPGTEDQAGERSPMASAARP
ncbi:MAG TPA: hypothetical protein VKW77_00330, partial [Acidimicrobiales bacterium]|nr:hypothetical protein [Acidimicrobiales bacterium]